MLGALYAHPIAQFRSPIRNQTLRAVRRSINLYRRPLPEGRLCYAAQYC